MKKTKKITLFALVMFTIFSVTSVKAATFKFELEDGTKKQIESNKNTVGELKKEIEATIGIMKEYQVWSIGEDYIREDMTFDDGEYEYLLNINNTDTIKIYERKELKDTIELKSYYPKEISSSLTGEELDKAKQEIKLFKADDLPHIDIGDVNGVTNISYDVDCSALYSYLA